MNDPDFIPDSPAFKACLKVAQTPGESVQFCVLLGASGTAPVLGLHRRKEGKALFNAAKQADKSLVKGTWGTATLDDKQLFLNCEKKISGLAKACKIWTKTHKSPFIKRVIPMFDGQVLEEDQDDLAPEGQFDADTPPAAAVVEQKHDPEKSDSTVEEGERRQLYHALVQSVKSCKGRVAAPMLEAAAKKAQAALNSGDFETAALVITSLQKIGEKQDGAADAEPHPTPVDFALFRTLGKQWQKLRDMGIKQSAAVAKLMLLDHPDSIAQARQIAGLYSGFDRKLAHCLATLATDLPHETRQKLTSATRDTVLRYHNILSRDPLFHHMAQNPYVEMNPQREMMPTLNAIAAALEQNA